MGAWRQPAPVALARESSHCSASATVRNTSTGGPICSQRMAYMRARPNTTGSVATMAVSPIGKTAIVATEPVVFGLARMYAILCEQMGPPVEVFRTVAEAEQWLDSRASATGAG